MKLYPDHPEGVRSDHPDYLPPGDPDNCNSGAELDGIERHPWGFSCTRELHHDDDHAAHGADGEMYARWPQHVEPRLKLRLPPRFYWDHVARDLPPGNLVKETKESVVVSMRSSELDELISDALYYSEERAAFGPEYFGLCASAAATVRAINKQTGGGDA